MIRVAAYSGGRFVPSARFRIRQYVPHLMDHGIAVTEMMAHLNSYPPKNRTLRPFWAVGSIVGRLPQIFCSYQYDVVLLQRSFISTLFTLEGLTKRPRVLDVDDAIFLLRDGKSARMLAECCDRVICGNGFLADWFSRYNKNIRILPTAVDTERYAPDEARFLDSKRSVVIGWIGTSANLTFLENILPAIARVMVEFKQVQLLIICDQAPRCAQIDPDRVDYIRWSTDVELPALRSMDIGIMPLEDSLWAQGKCSYKMLQYMSMGLPVVVSPVGMNNEILIKGGIGFAANSIREWADSLAILVQDPALRLRMGNAGRIMAEASFSIKYLAPKLANCLKF